MLHIIVPISFAAQPFCTISQAGLWSNISCLNSHYPIFFTTLPDSRVVLPSFPLIEQNTNTCLDIYILATVVLRLPLIQINLFWLNLAASLAATETPRLSIQTARQTHYLFRYTRKIQALCAIRSLKHMPSAAASITSIKSILVRSQIRETILSPGRKSKSALLAQSILYKVHHTRASPTSIPTVGTPVGSPRDQVFVDNSAEAHDEYIGYRLMVLRALSANETADFRQRTGREGL